VSTAAFPAAPSAIEHPQSISHPAIRALQGILTYTALSTLVFLVHGYHPYSQDAAIYVAGVEKELNPSLFTVDAAFVESHAHLSIFSPVMASISRYLHVSLDFLLLFAYFASVALFLVACHRLASRLFQFHWAQWGGTLLPAACFTIPVAGTSLLLMDPYVTARSFSTPLSILAVVCCLDRSWRKMALWATLAIAFYPLMGAYLVGFLLVLGFLSANRCLAAMVACLAGFLLCGAIALIVRFVPISEAYRAVVRTHGHLFLSEWRWYEIAGLIAPLALMRIASVRCGIHSKIGQLATASMLVGITAYLSSICFVHASHPDFLARIQLLRAFDIIYCAGAVMLGGFLVSYFWSRGIWIGIACFAVAFLGMANADNQSYLESQHMEMPGGTATNPWEQAFQWIRDDTPQNAVFAADSTMLTVEDEDAQGFRVITERSILNGAKDEGVASLFPALAPDWLKYRNAEQGLNQMADNERISRLRPYGVTWLLLSATAATDFYCPYRNAVLAVCRMP